MSLLILCICKTFRCVCIAYGWMSIYLRLCTCVCLCLMGAFACKWNLMCNGIPCHRKKQNVKTARMKVRTWVCGRGHRRIEKCKMYRNTHLHTHTHAHIKRRRFDKTVQNIWVCCLAARRWYDDMRMNEPASWKLSKTMDD